ncbi:MAG TPA: PadR family transcriptional regulator [Opitutaceae bacterium]|jgi:transcriptional regulator
MDKPELFAGTLDLLILKVLGGGPLHGFAIAERIHALSRSVLIVEEGSLYPCLYRMDAKGWIEPEWGQSDKGRRAKFYSLTPLGRKQLASERAAWDRMAVAIGDVLRSS